VLQNYITVLMMNNSDFALWKFKNIEGVLDGFFSSEFNITKFFKNTEQHSIVYNLNTETCEIKINGQNPIKVSFDGLVDKLKELGYYEERTYNRHSSSFK